MNWNKLKVMFPKCYDDILEFHKNTGHDGRYLIEQYVYSWGYIENYYNLLPILKEIENKK